jgi:hypothetical protein
LLAPRDPASRQRDCSGTSNAPPCGIDSFLTTTGLVSSNQMDWQDERRQKNAKLSNYTNIPAALFHSRLIRQNAKADIAAAWFNAISSLTTVFGPIGDRHTPISGMVNVSGSELRRPVRSPPPLCADPDRPAGSGRCLTPTCGHGCCAITRTTRSASPAASALARAVSQGDLDGALRPRRGHYEPAP